MKEVCICGRFDKGIETSRGQVIKTRMIYEALCAEIGKENIEIIDLYGGASAMPRIFAQLLKSFRMCKRIIIMPAYRGLRILTPLCSLYNSIFKREMHYIVIGGWLSSFIEKHKSLYSMLLNFNKIYVETSTMKRALEGRGFKNIVLMKNFKVLDSIKPEDLDSEIQKPYRVCTFSRVMEKKGIEDAINAVVKINQQSNSTVFTYDIYGEISPEYREQFERLSKEFPDYIKYRGLVPYDQSVNTLKHYFALLFPTKFYTEGIPGTIIDAYASGVPVIAAKWESFDDVIDDRSTGIGYRFDDQRDFVAALEYIADNPQVILDMKQNCLKKSKEFSPQTAMNTLLTEMGIR